MKKRINRPCKNRQPDPQSYEAFLTEAQREKLYANLRSEMVLDEVVREAVPWRDPRSGKGKLHPPSHNTLKRIRLKLNLEEMLDGLQESVGVVEQSKEILKPLIKDAADEKLLDQAMALITCEVITKTLKGLNPMARDSAARLLLKRADQRRVDRKLNLLESTLKKDGAKKDDSDLTPEEREAAVKQIFGVD